MSRHVIGEGKTRFGVTDLFHIGDYVARVIQDDRTLNQLLKAELGFQGYVMSDWGAHHSTIAAIGGLDVSTSRAILGFGCLISDAGSA